MQWQRLVDVDEARRLLLDAVAPAARRRAGSPPDMVPLAAAVGRVLARDAVAGDDVPGFARSRVDGYAVRARDTFGASDGAPAYLELVGEVLMGEAAGVALPPPGGPGLPAAVAVPTGGMLPAGADAVVMLEHVEVAGAGGPAAGRPVIAVLRPAAPGQNVVSAGDDARRGERVVQAGRRLRPQEVGALAGIGWAEVPVYPAPEVALLSSGDEVVPPERPCGPGQVRDMNGPALAAALGRDGARVRTPGIVPDRRDDLLAALRAAAGADLVLISGGSSVGARDLVARAVAELGPPGVLCHGIAIRPGKPTLIASANGVALVGLPGHPVSALVVYELVVRGALRALAGEAPAAEPDRWRRARLACDVGSVIGRDDYISVELDRRDGGAWATPVPGNSSLMTGLVRARGLVRIPARMSGAAAGDEVDVLCLD